MKTPDDMVLILYAFVSASALKEAITGEIYKGVRPSGSVGEDIVINALPVNGAQFQRGTANVNIYVPDLDVTIGGKPQTVPDMQRRGELSSLAASILTEYNTQTYRFWVSLIATINEPEAGQSFVNLRVDFQFFSTL